MFSKSKTESDRLQVWRDFRQSFPDDGKEEDIIEAFKPVKIERRFIDYYTVGSWPGVFEIVQQGMFCQSGLTLVIAATMSYHGFIKSDDIALEVISNYITGVEGLVLKHEGLYYNFIPGEIVTPEFVKENSTTFDKHIIAVDKLYS